MSARGGKRPGSGRKPGSHNKATAEVQELARSYAPAALKEAARLAKEAVSEAARISAINTILDRAYGKPPQALEHSGAGGAPFQVVIAPGDRYL